MLDDLWYMKLALEEADIAFNKGEVPVGAVFVSETGKVLSKTHNEKETHHNPCGHAEIMALTAAGKEQKAWRLTGGTLYVTLEPCPMCLAACVQARVKRVVFGAYDSKGGALSLNYKLNNDFRLNHKFAITGGIYHYQCSKVISDFFKQRRGQHK